MKNFYKALGIGVVFVIFASAFSHYNYLKELPTSCEVESEQAQKMSVQINNIYTRVFGETICSPHKVVLQVPANPKIDSQYQENEAPYRPVVSTMLTFSGKEKNFYIRRIDQLADGLFYSGKDSCLSWHWSGQSEQQTLTLDTTRNLQIYDSKIKGIIFIISLPVEIKKAKAELTIKRYTWDRAGTMPQFSLAQDYPILREILRDQESLEVASIRDQDTSSLPIGKVSDDLTEELKNIVELGAVLLEENLVMLKKGDLLESYIPGDPTLPCGEMAIKK